MVNCNISGEGTEHSLLFRRSASAASLTPVLEGGQAGEEEVRFGFFLF